MAKVRKQAVLSLSGGMDSAVLLYKAALEADEVYTVTFDYGQRHKTELDCVNQQLVDCMEINSSVKFYNKVLDLFEFYENELNLEIIKIKYVM